MNMQTMIKIAIVAALVRGAAMIPCVQGAPSVDDSVIAALDAEIAQGGKAEGNVTAAKADKLIKSLEAEISRIGEAGEDGLGGKSKESESISVKQVPSGQNVKVAASVGKGGERRRASKDSKSVIYTSRGKGKTLEEAERAARSMAVVNALSLYAGRDPVKERFKAIFERAKTVADDVIDEDKYEVIEKEQKDGSHIVRVRARIKKMALAPKFSDMFPEAFEGVETEATSPVGRVASSGRNSAASSTGGHGGAGSSATKELKEVTVTVMGKGETKEEAKLAAFRAAVEKAVGVWVDAESLMQNSEMLKDRVNTISNADIKRYETIKEGRLKSGLYACQIKAWVEKKAITPKFANVFPAAFADVGNEASTIHVQKVTGAKRSGDAASLMTDALEGVDRMRNWTRLSVVKGKALEEVKKIGNRVVNEVPGKGLYSVRYSMKIDEDAYFKGFLPHFKEVLIKMQEGKVETDVVLTSGPFDKRNARFGCVENDGDGRAILVTANGNCDLPPDLKPFTRGGGKIGNTFFVEPIVLAGFPGVAPNESLGWSDSLSNGSFMFERYESTSAKVKETRTCNIWLLDGMNKDRTSVQCSAYKVPTSALLAYWKNLYGRNIDRSGCMTFRTHEKIEVVLLDGDGEEIAARIDDHVPVTLLANGPVPGAGRCSWRSLNVFNSFFVRPMFVNYSLYPASMGRDNGTTCYSTEIQREVYFPLTDAQLEKVKSVKVRFVGGKRK